MTKQFRFLKLVWPMKTYQLLITDRGRVMLAKYSTFGGFTDQEAHERASVRVSDVTAEKQSWLKKKPTRCQRQQLRAFVATLPNRDLDPSAVPADFVNALNA